MTTETTNLPATIRDLDDARAWIQHLRPHVLADVVTTDDGPVIVETHTCGRCGGTGIYSQFHGTCWECGGVRSTWRTRTPLVKFAQRLKRQHLARQRSAAKRRARAEERQRASEERQRDWCEREGHGRITFEELRAKREQEREERRTEAPTGKREVIGKVISLKHVDSRYGAYTRMTVVVEDDNGEWLVNLRMPVAFCREPHRDGFGKGAVVRFTATLERGNEPHFVFGKRPTGAEVMVACPEHSRWFARDDY